MSAVTAGSSCQKSSPKRLDPSSACLQKSCRHSGKKSATSTSATVSSGLTATTRCGGHVISAQTAFLTSGRLESTLDHQGPAVLSAQAHQHVSITRWPDKHHSGTILGCQEEPPIVTRPCDRLQPDESSLEVQCLHVRMAGFSNE